MFRYALLLLHNRIGRGLQLTAQENNFEILHSLIILFLVTGGREVFLAGV